MPVRIVHSKQNARLKELRSAMAHPARGSHREESGASAHAAARSLAGIEGPNLLEEALRAGLHVPCVFAAPESQHWLENLPLPAETEILLVDRDVLASALATETPQPIAALLEPPDWTWAHLLGRRKKSASLLVILAGLQDPGNLGTILRSAEAFGANGVLSLPGTVSGWNPKAVRASAGSIFRVPLLPVTAEECFTRLHEAEIKVFATAVRGATSAARVDMVAPVALLIGNEGNGVPEEIAALAGGAITIPCPGPVESLNASVAASVLLYEASRQRAIANPLGDTA